MGAILHKISSYLSSDAGLLTNVVECCHKFSCTLPKCCWCCQNVVVVVKMLLLLPKCCWCCKNVVGVAKMLLLLQKCCCCCQSVVVVAKNVVVCCKNFVVFILQCCGIGRAGDIVGKNFKFLW